MAFRLIPKEESFYDMFEQLSGILVEGADVLVEAMAKFESVAESAKRLERLEHDGDQITHDIIAKLNRTFITPIDREDIHRLASDLDDVLDLMEAATERFILYRVTSLRPEAEQIAKVIQQQVRQVQQMLPKLRHLRHERILEHCIEINRLENTGDRILRDSIGRLFEGTPDPLTVLKWRGLYELLEVATDRCQDIANTVEAIVLKHA
jgi:predicted phosphate transport protein (TIGR00153 family)